MNVETAINETLTCSMLDKTMFFEDKVSKELPRKDLMEAYAELSIRDPHFYSDLTYCLEERDKNLFNGDYNKVKKGYYPYIRFQPSAFVRILSEIVLRFNIKSFLDVGAGFGDKVKIASKLINKAHGIECFKDYINTAKSLGVSLIWADAFKFNRYKNYDLIYMYHPIEDEELYEKMLDYIMKNMRVGGYILEVLPNHIFIKCAKKHNIKIFKEFNNYDHDFIFAIKEAE